MAQLLKAKAHNQKEKIYLIFAKPKEVLQTNNKGGTNYDVTII